MRDSMYPEIRLHSCDTITPWFSACGADSMVASPIPGTAKAIVRRDLAANMLTILTRMAGLPLQLFPLAMFQCPGDCVSDFVH